MWILLLLLIKYWYVGLFYGVLYLVYYVYTYVREFVFVLVV